MTQTSISGKTWALLVCLGIIWGGSFLSNRIALEEIGTFTIVAFRVSGGAVLMWAYVLARGLPLPKDLRYLGIFLVMGALNSALPCSLIVWGQNHVPSGLAAILNAATAVFGVGVAALVFADEKLTRRKALGLALGFGGVTMAIGISNLAALDLSSIGQIAVLGASLSYAFAGAFGRFALRSIRPEVTTAGALTAAALIMLPTALIAEGAPTLAYSPATWAALAYLIALASTLAYMIFYTVLAQAGAGNVSLVTLLVAPVAIVLGALVYGEALPWNAYAGFVLLALGLLVIDGRMWKYLRSKAHA